MKAVFKYIIPFVAIIAITSIYYLNQASEFEKRMIKMQMPYDQLDFKRGFPKGRQAINAMQEAKLRDQSHARSIQEEKAWKIEGPTNPGGRINVIAVHPENKDIRLIGACKGGIFKTDDHNENWYPIFDENAELAVSAITFAPSNPDVIYVGTGDLNISGSYAIGNGAFKSTDGGETWNSIGLEETGIVARIIVHPKNEDILYAGTMGFPHARDNNRGLYKSIDGGENWEQILFVSNDAGIIDMSIDPEHPDTIFAASWNRTRNDQESLIGGDDAFVWRTTDGGESWTKLSNGLPSGDQSRIGIDFCEHSGRKIYASYCDADETNLVGVYRSDDLGDSWSRVDQNNNGDDISNVYKGFGWYFGQVRVNPFDSNEVFLLGVGMFKSTNGGKDWSECTPPWHTYEVHADKHDLVFSLEQSTVKYILATDGGLYETEYPDEYSWYDVEDLPITQFYHIAKDPHSDSTYYGGAQDNGTYYGHNGLSRWMKHNGGDGFNILFDQNDWRYIYSETQNGNLYCYDREDDYWVDFNIDVSDRRAWDMPITIKDMGNISDTYTGTYRVYRMEDAPHGSWTSISNTLTDENYSNGDNFHVITCLGNSEIQNYMYAGTSDGNVWAGNTESLEWTDVTSGLPNRYVTSVKASSDNNNVVFVTHSGYRDGDYLPHIHKSTNRGDTWEDISSNLPELPIYDVEIVEGSNDQLIFVGTDAGVYYSENGGDDWNRLGNNMPYLLIYDIVLDRENQKLLAGTFARSMWSIDVSNLVGQYTGLEVASLKDNDLIKVYPNPASSLIQIDMPVGKEYRVDVIDASGRTVITEGAFESIELNIDHLENGQYFIRVSEGDRQTVRSLTVQH